MLRLLTAFGASNLLAARSTPTFAQDDDASGSGDQKAWAKLERLRQKLRGTAGESDVEFVYRLRSFVYVEIEAGRPAG